MSTILDACPSGTIKFTIPSRITRIQGSQKEINAFYDCSTTLQNFDFEAGEPQLEIIDNYAFYHCTELQEINLSRCTKLISIGDYSFSECSSVSSIILPENLDSIGMYCFSQILSITEVTIPASVTTIQSHIFYKCSSLKTVNIQPNSKLQMLTRWMIGDTVVEEFTVPKSVVSISFATFEVSYSLINIFVEEGNSQYVDDNGVLYSSYYKNLVAYPVSHSSSYTIHENCLITEYSSFSNAKITTIILNNVLTKIGDYSFKLTNIKSISIPETTTIIGDNAFNGCKSLKSIKFPSKLTRFSKYMFANCQFTNFTVPESIQVIQEFCFSNNDKLKLVILPINLQSLGGGAFSNCHKDLVITFPKNSLFTLLNQTFIVDINIINLTQYLGFSEIVTLPSTIEIIKAGAFRNNNYITEIICGDNLKTIEEKAFTSCSNLQKINIDSVEIISNNAFESCPSISALEFGNNLIHIHEYAFHNCTKLNSVTFAETAESHYIEQYAFFSCSNLQTLTLTSSLQYIEQYAFANCTSLSFVKFPSTIRYLGISCFEGSGITEANFSIETSSLTELRDSCFKDCANLSSLSLPESIESIGSLCFSNTLIIDFAVPLSTKSIGDQCFTNCPRLSKFIIPENSSLQTIGSKPFSGCYSLSDIDSKSTNFVISTGGLYNQNKERLIAFPPASSIKYFTLSENVRYISNGAFSDCTKLQIITIPDNSAIEIGFSAFEGCINLRTINIPQSVKTIGINAFANCKSLRCGLSIDETDHDKLNQWINEAKLPLKSVSECKEKTCYTKYNAFQFSNLIFIFLGTL